MKKAIVIGSHGMAGHVIKQTLLDSRMFNVVDIARGDYLLSPIYSLDITRFDKLQEIIVNERPEYIINCVGILNQDAEQHPDMSILINSYFPHFVAKCCDSVGAKLIHISSDCVFKGSKGNYIETDTKDGVGFYAQSKALGEVTYGKHLAIRTSIVGPELKQSGIGLLHWFLKQEGETKGYTNAFWSGVTTIQLAKSILKIITENDIRGIVHLTNNTKISKYNLLLIFKKVFKRSDISVIPYDVYKVDKSLLNTRDDFHPSIPSYYEMIIELKEWMIENKYLYSYRL